MIKQFIISAAFLITLSTINQGCATIASSSTYPVRIRTEPKNAGISITNKKGVEIYKGNSPATVSLKAGAGFFTRAEYQVKITAPGYDERIVPITFKLDGWYWGNLLIGGLLGMLIIDPATGAMWKIADPAINETLVKSSPGGTTVSTLQVIDVAEIPDQYKDKLIKIK